MHECPGLASRAEKSTTARRRGSAARSSAARSPRRRTERPRPAAPRTIRVRRFVRDSRAPGGFRPTADGCRCRCDSRVRHRNRSGSGRRHGRSLHKAARRTPRPPASPQPRGRPDRRRRYARTPPSSCRSYKTVAQNQPELERFGQTDPRARIAPFRVQQLLQGRLVDRAHHRRRAALPSGGIAPSPARYRENALRRSLQARGRLPAEPDGAAPPSDRRRESRGGRGSRAADRAGHGGHPRRDRAEYWSAAMPGRASQRRGAPLRWRRRIYGPRDGRPRSRPGRNRGRAWRDPGPGYPRAHPSPCHR